MESVIDCVSASDDHNSVGSLDDSGEEADRSYSSKGGYAGHGGVVVSDAVHAR